jgi:hypothetical protein
MMNGVLATAQRKQQLVSQARNEVRNAIPVEVGLEELEGWGFGGAGLISESVVFGAEGGLGRGGGCEGGREEKEAERGGDPGDGPVGSLLPDVGLKTSHPELPFSFSGFDLYRKTGG